MKRTTHFSSIETEGDIRLKGAPVPIADLLAGEEVKETAILRFLLPDGTPVSAMGVINPNGEEQLIEVALGSIDNSVGVRLIGSYLYIDISSIALGIPGASLGSSLIATGFNADGNPLLGWREPAPSAYNYSCVNTDLIPIHSGTGTGPWVGICTVTTLEEIDATLADIYKTVHIVNDSNKTGSIEFSVGKDGADPEIINFEDDVAKSDDRVISHAGRVFPEGPTPIGTMIELMVRGTGDHDSFDLYVDGTKTPSTLDIKGIVI